MRVIAGTARSLPLKTIDGVETRPTIDRIKETLFNMLQSDIHGSRFLDLFSGSGTTVVACEQNGRDAYAMEFDPKYCDVIVKRWENLTGEKAVLVNDN